MSMLNPIFDKHQVLQGMKPEERAGVLDAVGEKLAEDPELNSGEHRQLRNLIDTEKAGILNVGASVGEKTEAVAGKVAEKDMLNVLAQTGAAAGGVAPTYPEQHKQEVREIATVGQVTLPEDIPEEVGPELREKAEMWQYAGPHERGTESTLGDLGNTAFDFVKQLPMAVARLPLVAAEMATYVGAGMSAIARPVVEQALLQGTVDPIKEQFNRTLDLVDGFNKGVQTRIKAMSADDPDMAAIADTVMMDFTISTLLAPLTMGGSMAAAAGRGGKVAVGVEAGLAGVAGGQVAQAAIGPAVERVVEDPTLENSVMLGVSILGGVAGGASLENMLQKMVRAPGKVADVAAVGDAVKAVERETPNIKPEELYQGLLSNENISDELKTTIRAKLSSLTVDANGPVAGSMDAGTAGSVEGLLKATPEPTVVAEASLPSADSLPLFTTEPLAKSQISRIADETILNPPEAQVRGLEGRKAELEEKLRVLTGELEAKGQDPTTFGPDALMDAGPQIKGWLDVEDELLAVDSRLTSLRGKVASGMASGEPQGGLQAPLMDRLGQLRGSAITGAQRRIMASPGFTDAMQVGRARYADMLGRLPTQAENDRLMLGMLDRHRQWKDVDGIPERGNTLLISKIKTPDGRVVDLPAGVDVANVNLSVVKGQFPYAAKVLSTFKSGEQALRLGRTSVADVAQAYKALNNNAGATMSPQAYNFMRPYVEDVNKLWDAVRGSVPANPTKDNSFIESLGLKAGEKAKMVRIVKALRENFPGLGEDINVTRGELSERASYDMLNKLMVINSKGDSKTAIKSFMHELGHYAFDYKLSAEERMGYIDVLKNLTPDSNSWQAVFPEYGKRLDFFARNYAEGKISEEAMAKARYWLNSPNEAYAQQMMLVLSSRAIPRAKSAEALQKGIDAFDKFLGLSGGSLREEFGKLSAALEPFFIKSQLMPDLRGLSRAQKVEYRDFAKISRLVPQEPEDALRYADELNAELAERYQPQELSGGLVDTVGAEKPLTMLAADMEVGDAFDPSDMLNPSAVRVMRYRVEDLNKALTIQAIRGFNEHSEFNPEELRYLMQRINGLLDPSRRGDLIERIAAQQAIQVHQEKQAFDALTGNPMEEMVGRQQRTTGAFEEGYRGASQEVPDPLPFYVKQKYQAYAEAQRADELAKGRKLTNEEISFRRRQVDLQLAKEAPNDEYDLLLANAQQTARAFDEEATLLMDVAKGAMVKQGLVDLVPHAIYHDLGMADDVARVQGMNAKQILGSAAWRSLVIGYAGLDSDPDGVMTPLGRVSWSLNNVNKKGMWAWALLGVAGGKPSVAGLRYMSKLTGEVVQKLPLKLRDKVEGLAQWAKQNFGPDGGRSPEQQALMQKFIRDRKEVQADFLELSAVLKGTFKPRERAIISMLATNETWPGWAKAVNEADPTVVAMAGVARAAYDKMIGELTGLGVKGKKLEEVRDYMNRVYLNKVPKQRGIFIPKEKQVTGLKQNYLIERGIPHTVCNKKGETGFSDQFFPDRVGADKELAGQLQGLQDTEGVVVNSYAVGDPRTGGLAGFREYAIKGSPLDKTLSARPDAKLDDVPWKVVKAGKKNVSLRRDYTFTERASFGETMDSAVKLAKFGQMVSEDIARIRAFNKMSVNQEAALTPARIALKDGISLEQAQNKFNALAGDTGLGFWKVPDVDIPHSGMKKYGELSGMLVTPEYKDVLLGMGTDGGLLAALKDKWPRTVKAHKYALTAWKLGKTSLQLSSHVTNIAGNIVQSWIGGENPFSTLKNGSLMMIVRNADIKLMDAKRRGDFATADRLYKQLRGNDTISDYYNTYLEAKRMQIGDSTMLTSDTSVKELMEEVLTTEQALTMGDMANPAQAALGIGEKLVAQGLLGGVMKGAKAVGQGGKAFVKTAANWYENGDLVFKLGQYKTARMEGDVPEEALKRAYAAHFDYGALPKGVQFMRDSGIMPFVSYMYKSTGLVARAVKEHPGRLAMAAAMLEGVHMRTMAASYGMEDALAGAEYEEQAMAGRNSGRRLGLFRSQTALYNNETTKANGDVVDTKRYSNVGPIIPGGDIFGTSVHVPTDSAISPLSPLAAGVNAVSGTAASNPVFSMLIAAATGKNLYLDKVLNTNPAVPGDAESEDDRLKAFGKFVWQTVTPNLPIVPGSLTSEKIMQGLAHSGAIPREQADRMGLSGHNSLGMPLELGTQIENLFGARFQDVDADKSMRLRVNRMKRDLTTAGVQTKLQVRGYATTPSQKQNLLEDFKGLAERQVDSLEYLDKVTTKGMSAKERYKKLMQSRDTGVSAPGLGF